MPMSDCDELWSAHPYERKSERVIERERDVWRRKLRAGKLRMRHNDREP